MKEAQPSRYARDLEIAIARSRWALALSDSERPQVTAESFERYVPAGGYAMRCGEPADCWIGVIDGLVKMSVSQADGRVSTLTGVTDGGWAGEGSLMRPGVWRYDGVAVRATRLACVPRYTFERLLATNIKFAHYLLSQLNARLSLFIGLVENDRLLGPEARVARALASLFNPDLYPRASSSVRLSQDEIGGLAGVSRQSANRALHQLEAQGLLRVAFGCVTVLDLPALGAYCGEPAVALA
jgi:CRP/FNR family cyclic AMP-dependent transcriptional regulator